MGKALQMISGYVTSPSAALATVTNSPTDTTAVQYFDPGAHGSIIDVWAYIAQQGVIRMKSPNFHDNVNGINLNVAAASPLSVFPADYNQPLVQNDVIDVALADSGGGSPAGYSSLWYYDNLPGANANLFGWDEIRDRIVNIMACQVSLTLAGTAGTYEGAASLISTANQFKASTNYALLGWETTKNWQSVGITGPDTSNRRLGGPGILTNIVDNRQWFVDLAKRSRLPVIPVLNQQNMAATVVDVIDTGTVGNGDVRLIFGQLRG